MMRDWKDKRVLIVGAARQGLALSRFLASKGARVTLTDQRGPEDMAAAIESLAGLSVEWSLGGHPFELLDGVDLVCLSGGVSPTIPLAVKAVKLGIELANDSQLFMEAVPCRVIGITGSAGKTTTTTLVGRMAQANVKSPNHAWVGGNIGRPLIDQIDEIQPEDLVVLELSSFQLELMTTAPAISAVLNITPNHLDRHGTLEAYTAAKAHILQFQNADTISILNRDDAGSWGLSPMVKGRLISFGMRKPTGKFDGSCLSNHHLEWWSDSIHEEIISVDEIKLRGEHNLMNVLAACAIGLSAGFSLEAVRAGIRDFRGVPHRLQFVRTLHGVDWYNDSIATAPERTMAAIRAFDEPITLMLGGRDKNLPWQDLVDLVHNRVDHVVVFGEASAKILTALGPVKDGQRPFTIQLCDGLETAVTAAASVAEPGSVVLLSPGGTSYDQYKDFEERGEAFQLWVNRLP